MGIDSADGTYLAFGPDVLLPNVLSWVRKHADPHDPVECDRVIALPWWGWGLAGSPG